MALRLYNTLSGQIEELAPRDGQPLGIYACGPTVYDYGHIGNFRTFIHVDILRRFLEQQGVPLRHVMNITDVDDKIIRNAAAAGVSIHDYTPKYERAFQEDLKILRIEQPEYIARATEHLPEMVALIEQLIAKGAAYRGDDGSYYFRIASFPAYGKLSKKDLSGMEDGARVDLDEYEKDSARDFALWKAAKPGEFHWETSLGSGRPGWHIECSAMAMRYLGDSFDLHAGGEDLMFPHHENEIAQSESATGKTFARHWMHVRFLLVEGKKMSKSAGNFFTLRDLLLRGYKASTIRFLLTSVPYRNPLNFTFDGLRESTNAVERLRSFVERLRNGKFPDGVNPELAATTEKAQASFIAALEDDLNTAEARAAIFDLVRAVNTAADRDELGSGDVDPILKVMARFDEIFSVLEDHDEEATRFALEWARNEGRLDTATTDALAGYTLSDAEIEARVTERNAARKSRDFAGADAIRNELAEKGILIEDGKDGVRWRRK
ncbi:MAG TPA: cysteine--tRNA ligase [Acidobacteriaceae bacterium]|nr:cysteine--tRNA ligase [Acidobacteriaceae bacterium]